MPRIEARISACWAAVRPPFLAILLTASAAALVRASTSAFQRAWLTRLRLRRLRPSAASFMIPRRCTGSSMVSLSRTCSSRSNTSLCTMAIAAALRLSPSSGALSAMSLAASVVARMLSCARRTRWLSTPTALLPMLMATPPSLHRALRSSVSATMSP